MTHNVSRLQQVEGQITAQGVGSYMAEVDIGYICVSTSCGLRQLCRYKLFVALLMI